MNSSPSQATSDVEERHRFDEVSLEAFLVKQLPNFQGGLTVKKFGYGQSNPTYFLSGKGGQQYVLRKKPPGKIIKGAHAVDREYRVMNVLGKAGFEVPKMLLFCDDENIIGTQFYVMSFVKGQIPDNGFNKLSPSQRRPAMESIVRTLAKLHSYDPTALGLVGGSAPYGKLGGFYERQISTMKRTSESQVQGSNGKVPPLKSMAELLALFQGNMPQDRSCVIHGDWKPDNVILSDSDSSPHVLAVVDWELSTIGHPLSDLANMCLPFHLGEMGQMLSYPSFDMSEGSGNLTEEELHRVYCEAANIPFPIEKWSFFVAFAMFRLSVIIQGVAMRASRGQASQVGSDQVNLMSEGANQLCDLAYQTMKKGCPTPAKL